MEVLPPSGSLFAPPTAVDYSSMPRSARSQLRQSSRSFMRPQSAPRTSISLFKEDKNWLEKLSLAISDYELYVARRPAASHLLTLSPIIASPTCPPTSTFSSYSSIPEVQLNSPATTEYTTAPNSPSIPPLFTPLPSTMLTSSSSAPPLASRQSSSDVLRITALSLLASTAFSAIMLPPAIGGAPESRGAPHHMRPINRMHRSFSDPSLSSRQVVINRPPEQADAASHPVLPGSHSGDNGSMSPRNRTKFRIAPDINIEGDTPLDSCDRTNRDSSLEGNYNNSELGPDSMESRDIIRRFHVLKELLTTEHGYLNDLKGLVNVYLRNLSTMTYRVQCLTRVPSFLVAGTRGGSHSSHPCSHPSQTDSTNRSRLTQRHCLSESEIQLLMRNAVNILHLHEGFLQELEAIMKVFGITMNPQQDEDVSGPAILSNLDAVIQAVAQKFLQQASHFHIYQDFCAGHLEALEIARTKQHQYPVEWDAFEHHCASVIFAQADGNGLASETRSSPGSMPGTHETALPIGNDRKRTASLDGAMRSLRVLASRESASSHFDIKHGRHARRLAFMDYLIKPIQRICKYPLLLDQLKPINCPRSAMNIDMTVGESIQAIKKVVVAVDEARHRKEIATKSSLIASRISLSSISSYPHRLSDAFLSSLGTCLLAGSLVMMHYPLTESKGDFGNAKPKQVGAFLYPGGYLILVRVLKGKIYEPKHWFCLANYNIQGVADDAFPLSSFFCLFSKSHVFEFAAACPGERTFWLSTIRESLAQSPTWTDEPAPSLDPMNPHSTYLDEIKSDFINTQSNYGRRLCDEVVGMSSLTDNSVQDGAYFKQDYTFGSIRASSSVSLKTIFAQGVDTSATVVRRSSATARRQTIDGLQDVVWRACLGGRGCEHHSRQVLQESKTNVSSFIRSNSAVSLKGPTRNRLSKDEARRVSRHNSLPNGGHSDTSTDLSKAKSMIVRKGNSENGCGFSESAGSETHALSPLPGPDIQALSPSPTSHADILDDAAQGPLRGLFRNVKGLFHARAVDCLIPSQRSSHQREKSGNNIFRRLSSRRLFQRNTPNDTVDTGDTGSGVST
ncbi:hypothetical protein AX15_007299 [Amanita polypyramis BW_CC]|nr:hypothetical protein AX15_007299 [Amanita polypyramis BW_CC]